MRIAPRVPYRACHDAAEAQTVLAEISPRTAIVDVEPLVAVWNTDPQTLDAGITAFLGSFARAAGHAGTIVFSTNSTRQPSALPAVPVPRVRYLSHAGKPLRIDPYRNLPRPGVVVGDQIATDGVLAWRLGLTFVHYIPRDLDHPIGTRFMRLLGRPLRHLLFRPDRL